MAETPPPRISSAIPSVQISAPSPPTPTGQDPREHPALDGRPLLEAMAVATRPVHTKLNKLILAKLPLALPPRAADPSNYVTGLLHIAAIFAAFESVWQLILDSGTVLPFPAALPLETSQTGLHTPPEYGDFVDLKLDGLLSDMSSVHTGRVVLGDSEDGTPIRAALVNDRARSLLGYMYFPDLMRTTRLRGDIIKLTGWSDETLDEQLRAVAESGRLCDFVQHIKRVVDKKPHVLLSYAYTLYMALFAGGRFIRASFEAVSETFWEHPPSPIKPTMTPCRRTERPRQRASQADEDVAPDDASNNDNSNPPSVTDPLGPAHSRLNLPLQFFHFATPTDGEDLKKEFKHRFTTAAEGHLTPRERADILQESVCIFDNMILLVGQLDAACRAADESDDDTHMQLLARSLSVPLGTRLRDSVAVAKERSSRASAAALATAAEAAARLHRTLKYGGSDDKVEEKDMARGEKGPDGQGWRIDPTDTGLLGDEAGTTRTSEGKSVRFETSLAVPRRDAAEGKTRTLERPRDSLLDHAMHASKNPVVSVVILTAGLGAAVGLVAMAKSWLLG